MNYIKKFEQISLDDVGSVGGKNASLGEMITHLAGTDIKIPTGFAITADAYWHYLDQNNLTAPLKKCMAQLTDIHNSALLQKIGLESRTLILSGTIPADLESQIGAAYTDLCARTCHNNNTLHQPNTCTDTHIHTADTSEKNIQPKTNHTQINTDRDTQTHTNTDTGNINTHNPCLSDHAESHTLCTSSNTNLCPATNCDVAVRSSATAEDLPTASFAGQQETFLHIHGIKALCESYKKCLASLFTDRAIVYRVQQQFDHFKVALSVGVQQMIRSDTGSAGVAFSLDTETGFKEVVMIESSYGLGESIVQGLVTPDSFLVHKPTLALGFTPIIKKKLGNKVTKIVYTPTHNTSANKNTPSAATEFTHDTSSTKTTPSIITEPVSPEQQRQFSITDKDIITIADAVMRIEEYYSQRAKKWVPMDIEWAKDGITGIVYIVQARPETIHGSAQQTPTITSYTLKKDSSQNSPDYGSLLATGQSVGNRIVSGTARIIKDASLIASVQQGDIIITEMTDPDWVPAMKQAAGIITQRGGRTCHAAIVSRELGITALVGASSALTAIQDGQQITIDCSRGGEGYVYAGILPFDTNTYTIDTLPKAPISLLVNIADPESAFTTSFLPTDGVGLARIEFIISNSIQIHPLALIYPERITNPDERTAIDTITAAYTDKKTFFIDTLAQGIGLIAAAFYPRPVCVRLSDLKTNEYRNLIGGSYFEPVEENPMIGFRGASRYCHEQYRNAFALECEALKKVRTSMGLTNVEIMIPFVRTIPEAHATLDALASHGLDQKTDNLTILMMCEIPSNVILIDQFSALFDGFSIGSNDLTQLTLGVDRDSALLATIFDEQDPAVTSIITLAIHGAQRNKKPIGICGQGPSDNPAFADFLIATGITSLSLNADSVVPFLMRFKK